MADFFFQLGLFASKTLVIFSLLGGLILLIGLVRIKANPKGELKIDDLGEKINHYQEVLEFYSKDKKELKKLKKQKKVKKDSPKPTAFVVDFIGDMKAEAVESLREEITAILSEAKSTDQVIIRVESPGGVVHGYGLAAAQILRLKNKNIQTTICVDKVAASGGYLMSVPAQKIYAAPFAIIGSIGVVAQVPNLHRLLKKHDVDYKEYTAGEFKRTISFLGEIQPKGEAKFQQQLEETHILFKDFVHQHRPQLNIAEIATGEHWYGEQALKKGLIDSIKTSDDYIMELSESHKVLQIKFEKKQAWNEKLTGVLGRSLALGAERVLTSLETRKFL